MTLTVTLTLTLALTLGSDPRLTDRYASDRQKLLCLTLTLTLTPPLTPCCGQHASLEPCGRAALLIGDGDSLDNLEATSRAAAEVGLAVL